MDSKKDRYFIPVDDEEEASYLEDLLEGPEEDDKTLGALLQREESRDSRRYDERDYQSHRRESFPHVHSHTRHSGRRRSTSTSNKPEAQQSIELESVAPGNVTGPSEFLDLSMSPTKKVQFEIGGQSPSAFNQESQPVPEKKKHHHRRHHHHRSEEGSPWHRKHHNQPLAPEDAMLQLVPANLDLGSDVALMDDLDLENLSSHRFSDNKSYRRHKFSTKFGMAAEDILSVGLTKQTKTFVHQPHEVFCELDILTGYGENRQWKEAARWIKYEEDLEEGADRWGRPHVASLSFHSLINLRRLIEAGVILLDLEERDLPGVAYRTVEAMVIKELIEADDKSMIMRALLLKHKHVNENEGLWRFHLRRNTTASGSLTSLHAFLEQDRHKTSNGRNNTVPDSLGTENSGSVPLPRRNSASSRLVQDSHTGIKLEESDSLTPLHLAKIAKLSLTNLSEEELKWVSNKENLLRRIPVGAETSIVLVGKDETLKRPVLAFIRLAESCYMPNVTELPLPVRFIFILLGPSSEDFDYKEIGRSFSTLMSNRHFHEIAYRANDKRDLLKGIHDFLDESIVLPPGDWDNELFPFEEMREKSQMLRRRKEKRRQSTFTVGKGAEVIDSGGDKPPDDPYKKPGDTSDPLKRSGRPFGGLIHEIKTRYRYYLSDFKDGLNMQTLASTIFIYFAAISGAIAFGGLLGKETDENIGLVQTLVTTSGGGIAFALFAGQPLIILGTTATLFLFDASLFKICLQHEIDFLAFRFWIGVWLVVIGLVVVAFDGSCIAKYFTRFIQETFAALIAILFIYETINNLAKIYIAHPLRLNYANCSREERSEICEYPNTALMSTVLCLGTFLIAYVLREFRNTGFFVPVVRKTFANFGVPIAVAAMAALDYGLFKQVTLTDKLEVPEFAASSGRSWILDYTNVTAPLYVLAIVPAGLVFILIFMETCICSLIVGKKEMRLVKGSGYHMDILLLCLINCGISAVGGCWVCAATVRTVAHTNSLVVYTTNNPPGEKPSVIGVKEQRLSALVISILIGLSVLMSRALDKIPMSVIFGVFLFMGISSIDGNQFFTRCSLLFKEVSKHPQVPYVRRVRTSKMHLFTLIQLVCLIILFAVKFTEAALAIPFLLILLVPLRLFGLSRIFKESELHALDGDGEEVSYSRPSLDAIPIPITKYDGDVKSIEKEKISDTFNNTNTLESGTESEFSSLPTSPQNGQNTISFIST